MVWEGCAARSWLAFFPDPHEGLDVKTCLEWCANPGAVARSLKQTAVQLLCGGSAGIYSLVMTILILKVMQLFSIAPILTYAEQQLALKDTADKFLGDSSEDELGPWSVKSFSRHTDQCLLPPWYYVVATNYLLVVLVCICHLLHMRTCMHGAPRAGPGKCRASVSLIMSSDMMMFMAIPNEWSW